MPIFNIKYGIICKTRHYVSLKVLRLLYYTLIYPYLHYGNIVWANTYQSNLDPLKKLQKKIIRIISFAGFTDHRPHIFKKLSLLPFDQVNKEKVALFMFRYFNKMLPSAFDAFFTLNKDLHNHNTRSSAKIHINYIRTNYSKRSIKCRGSQIWNSLPTAVKTAKSNHIFKKLSLLPFDQVNKEKVALFMFRYFNKMLPSAFDAFFTLNKDLHNHNTRSSAKIHINYIRTNYSKRSIKCRGSQIWNSLPTAVKTAKSIYIFKKKKIFSVSEFLKMLRIMLFRTRSFVKSVNRYLHI